MHAQSMKNFEHFKACRAYETAFALKAEGKVRHVGISFHDSAEMLDRILTEYPQLEAVQLQFNYVDYDDPAVQSRRCYEVCRKHGKPVIVMEPVRAAISPICRRTPQRCWTPCTAAAARVTPSASRRASRALGWCSPA